VGNDGDRTIGQKVDSEEPSEAGAKKRVFREDAIGLRKAALTVGKGRARVGTGNRRFIRGKKQPLVGGPPNFLLQGGNCLGSKKKLALVSRQRKKLVKKIQSIVLTMDQEGKNVGRQGKTQNRWGTVGEIFPRKFETYIKILPPAASPKH